MALGRRAYIKLAGVGVPAYGKLGYNDIRQPSDNGSERVLPEGSSSLSDGGPPNSEEWTPTFEDQFEANSLDTDVWEVGWGWGRTTWTSATRATAKNVEVDDGLHLTGTHEDGQFLAGCVNTKNKVTVEPGSYFEAKLRFPEREGFLPAFWAKPNSERWPPEIDVVELYQDGSGRDDTHKSRHYVHYSKSLRPGDKSTHVGRGGWFVPGDDLTKNYHVYAVEWQSDHITHYVDGEVAWTTTNPDIMTAMERGAPFYLMLTLSIDKIGNADPSEPWGESLDVDWVRIWR